MEKTKAETYIGFVVRAGKFKAGCNTLATVKKAYLVILCRSAEENSRKLAVKYADKFRCKAFATTNKDLSEYVHKDGIKIMCVTDRGLAEAIINNSEKEFIEIEREKQNG